MYHIVKNRENRRIPKLKDILVMVIDKKKKEMAATHRQNHNKDWFSSINPTDTYLTPEQFSLIKEQSEKINQTLEKNDFLIDSIDKKMNYVLRKRE